MTGLEAPEPDRVVETALRLLPVPEHDPGFWNELEARLDREPAPTPAGAAPIAAPVTAPEEPERADTDQVPAVALEAVPLGVVPPAMRRPSNVVLSVLAVAAAVAVVVAGSALVRSRAADDTPDEAVAGPAATEPEAGEGTTVPTASALTAPDGQPEAQVVVDWVTALAGGDLDAAWALLGPGSQAHWGSASAFAAERTGLAEGYGAWASAAADQVIVTPVIDGSLAVVTLVGTVEQEGRALVRADAFPIRDVGGDLRLELYASTGAVEIVVPGDPAADGTPAVVTAGEELVVVVPDGAHAPVLRLDDGPPVTCGDADGTELTALEGPSGQRCGYQPAALEPGTHVLTVVAWSDDGASVTAHSVRFTLA